MMRGLRSNEGEIARGILMVHFSLLLRLLFSECSLVVSSLIFFFLFIVGKHTLRPPPKKKQLT